MIKIGIDQSMAASGIVILEDDKEMIHHSVIKTKKEEGTKFERFNTIGDSIIDLIKLYNVDEVAIEGLPMGNIRGNVSRDLAGLQSVIICKILSTFKKECKIIAPKAVKKFATDNGNAKKPEMVEALPENIRQEFVNSNFKKSTGLYDLADAYWICLYQ